MAETIKMYFLTFLETGKSKVMVLGGSVSGESSHLGVRIAAFCVLIWPFLNAWAWINSSGLSSSYKSTSPAGLGLHPYDLS